MKTPHEAAIKRKIERSIEELGPSPSVLRFLNKYGKDNTKRIYSICLVEYLRWLKQNGITLNPDDLLRDNLKCVYESSATDVQSKRKHTDWLDDYVNRYLVETGRAQNTRIVTGAVIQQFYKRNDSPLFGDFQVSRAGQREPARPLDTREIRIVLKTLSLGNRMPLLCLWQSGIEINRLLSLTWSKVEGVEKGEYPLRVELFGRKKHERQYFTYLGREAIEHLKIWKGRWSELGGRLPGPRDPIFIGKGGSYLSALWLNIRLKKVAVSLHKQGLIANGDARSWHTHALRHSFRTEAAHAGVKTEVSEFFLGHLGGINYVYNHRDQLHADDMAQEYVKIEPFISLDFTEATLRQEYEGTSKEMVKMIAELQKKVAGLEARSGS